jgi:hypothetical protein
MELSKEEMIAEINRMDPMFFRLSIDLDKFTEEEIKKHYLRKKNAPISKNRNSGWYANFKPSSRQVTAARTDGFEEVVTTQEKDKGVALTGFDALNKERV